MTGTRRMPTESDQAVIGRRGLLRKAAIVGGSVVGLAGGVGVAVVLNGSSSTGQNSASAPASGTSGAGGAKAGGSGAAGSSESASASGSASHGATHSPSASASRATSAPGSVFPSLLHPESAFERMATNVTANAQPWLAGWNKLVANAHSQSTWKARPAATVVRGGSGAQNYTLLYNDIHAAYQNAVRWKVSGDTAHADAARDILNAWSATLKTIDGDADRFLAAGIYGYQAANAAALIAGYSGFDLAGFRQMMLNVFYPMNNDFLTHHNGACITNYWANWDLCNMASVLAIGILCEDQAKTNQAVDYFKNGAGNGSITHAVPFLYPGGLGQWQESGRDQGHATLGIGLMGAICEMAWNQGIDLYGYDDNRFLAGCEYVAKYNLGYDVPFTSYTWRNGDSCALQTQSVVSAGSRGDVRPIWELVYNHYVKRQGLSAPNVAAFAAKVRPEGGGGDYGPDSGGFDQLGFGTLLYTL
jgi:hypothetical protein